MNECLEEESGLTLIEVIVAALILVVGVLGTVTIVDAATRISNNTKAREGATSVSREIAEAARLADYDSLDNSTVVSSLQAQNGLADADSSQTGWQLIRRGITYTETVTACKYDDPKDGTRSTSDTGTYCSQSPAPIAPPPTNANCTARDPQLPCVDTNPDDYRRLLVTSSWTMNAKTSSSSQVVLIVNPSGGRGPRITSFTLTTPTSTDLENGQFGPSTPGHVLTYTIQTSGFAGSVDWSTSNAVTGTATNTSGNTWTFTWDISPPLPAPAVVDGNYSITAQAYSLAGTPGDLSAVTIQINRSAPVAPTHFAGGRDTRILPGIVDLQWGSNPEFDILGYRVYRGTSTTPVCGTASTPLAATSCIDSSPPAGALTYRVVAVDTTTAGAQREGAGATLNVSGTASNAPTFPAGATVTATIQNGVPNLSWPAATADTANGRSILFYRIYRDPATSTPQYTERYDRTGGSNTTYVDSRPGTSTAHRYYVTAVDDTFQESQPIVGNSP